jgi:hypothetical protein
MLEPSYPQTDTRQTERQRERQGNVVDFAEQEFERSRETLRQMGLAKAQQHTEQGSPVKDVPAEGFGHDYPGSRGWDDWETWETEH